MVRCEQLTKRYRPRRGEVIALDGVDLDVKQGEFVVVRGPSGSGKTTLLLAVGGMMRPTGGRVIVAGGDLYAMTERQRARFRADHVGFVFQMFHLIGYLSVVENVLMASGAASNAAGRAQAESLLEQLGMSPRRGHKPAELSAGEKQRVAIARAMLNQPELLLADEPTGNLDPDHAGEVFRALAAFHRAGGTVLVVTHGATADEYADRIVYLRGGRIDTPDHVHEGRS